MPSVPHGREYRGIAMNTVMWVLIATAVGLVLIATAKSTKSRFGKRLVIVGLVLAVSGLGLSVADKAGAASMSRPAENHDVQCIAGGLGVAGAWLGTLGSIPTTGGLVTAGAAAASVGATVAWYDSCPSYARKVIAFINPAYTGYWVLKTVWQKLSTLVSDSSYSYHSTGRFCVARYGSSVKRCFLWKNLTRNQMHQAFRQWLVMYNVPARLYMGQLYVVR